MIGLVLGVLEVAVWDRTSILENIPWHRHGEGDMVTVMGGVGGGWTGI